MTQYKDKILDLALDLAKRLLPAFDTPTGIPYARVNLRRGVEKGESTETCEWTRTRLGGWRWACDAGAARTAGERVEMR